ncbi:ATP-binding cassette domain-containing protein [Facklamia miroungae]|uniref:ABC-2 type transport system ATP-binding protein n=1 Tax=Facklamia miroungae TaxID=120956 RepID=A0A1G7TY51_9LACT|nr:ABC transporter ATP-binding protein [Facklamia miroungae]NKZ30003.1 ABC transporter ATP-binding protein [Facklamia miroungae]SDG39659.1 ABC-2 type transport system ATP-binding protein [Facklamia miroungae]
MIRIENLNKSFGKRKVLKDINLEINPGEITGLIGINGTGKSTLINCIARLLPYQGEIYVDEMKLKDSESRIWHVPDYLNFPPSMTVKACKEFMYNLYPAWNPSRAKDIQDFFQLEDEAKIKELSKGNQAKLNLMLGLALDADYLLLDEPFAGIDVFSREQILELFGSFIQKDCGVLVTTHELYDVEHFIDRAVLMSEGQIKHSVYLEDMRENEELSLVEWLRKELK